MIVFTIFTIILAAFAALAFNFALYRSVDTLYEELPKWVHILLLIPPVALISILVISMVSIVNAICETIKNL